MPDTLYRVMDGNGRFSPPLSNIDLIDLCRRNLIAPSTVVVDGETGQRIAASTLPFLYPVFVESGAIRPSDYHSTGTTGSFDRSTILPGESSRRPMATAPILIAIAFASMALGGIIMFLAMKSHEGSEAVYRPVHRKLYDVHPNVALRLTPPPVLPIDAGETQPVPQVVGRSITIPTPEAYDDHPSSPTPPPVALPPARAFTVGVGAAIESSDAAERRRDRWAAQNALRTPRPLPVDPRYLPRYSGGFGGGGNSFGAVRDHYGNPHWDGGHDAWLPNSEGRHQWTWVPPSHDEGGPTY